MMNSVEIERLVLGEYRRLTSDWESLSRRPEVLIQQIAGEMAIGIRTFINKTERTIERRKICYPKTAWDHVKQDWLPLWTRRFTVIEYETAVVETKHTFLCPHIDFGGREAKIHVAYLQQGNMYLGDTDESL